MGAAGSRTIISGMAWKFGESIVTQGVGLVVQIVLARLLMPSDYGAIAIISLFVSLANVLLTSGLGASLIQKKEITEEEISSVFYCNVLMGIALYAVIFLAAPLIAWLYEMPILIPAIRVYGLILPIASIQSIQSAVVSRNMEFKKFFLSTLSGTVISGAIGILLALKGFGIWALVATSLINACIDTFVLFLTVRWSPKRMFSMRVALPLIRYGWKIMANLFLEVVMTNLGAFMIGLKYSTADLAYYNKGIQLPRIVRGSIFSTFTTVLFSAMSKVGDDPQGLKAMLRKFIRTANYVIYPAIMGMACVSAEFVDVVYTSKWLPMVPFIIFACLETLFSTPSTIILEGMKAMGKSGIYLKIGIVTKIVAFACTLLGMLYGSLGVGISLVVATMICWIFICFQARRHLEYGLREQLADCLKAGTMAAGMCMVVGLCSFFPIGSTWKLIIKVLAGIASYTALSYIAKDDSARSLLAIAKTYLGKFKFRRKTGHGIIQE